MRKLLLIISFLAPAALWGQTPNCQFAVTFTSATRSNAFPAQSTPTGAPCISWRVTYQASNMSGVSLAFQGSPDNGSSAPTGSWTTLGGSCPASNPCTINVGTNPMTDTSESNLQVTGYYPWVSLNMTTFTGTGSVLVKVFGYQGTSASGSGSGGGGGGSTAWSALTNPIANLALTMQAFTSTWTFNASTGAGANLFTLTDTLNNTGTGDLLRLTTKSGSAAIPLQADANGVGARVNASGNLTNVGASLLDYSGGNFKMPTGAGFTATATNNLGFDSTNNNVHIWDNADGIVAPFASAPTTGHCVQATVSGGSVTLADSGSTNCGGGGGVSWSAITNPSGNLALTMGANTSTFTFNATTGAGADLFKWTDTTNNTGTGALGHFTTASGSAAIPIEADSNGKGFEVNSNGNVVNVGASNLDWSAGNQFRVPVAASATSSANGAIAYDTTAGITHVRTAGADSDVLATTATDTTTTDAVFATGTAGLYTSRAITSGDLPAAIVYNNTTNTGTAAMTLNMAASTTANAFRVPVGAGLTSGANGVIAYDSTAGITHIRTNGADSDAAATTTTDTTTTHALFASATAGIYTSRAIATGDLPSIPWSQLTNPTGNLSLTMAADTSLFTYNATTGSGVDLFELTDTTNNTGTGNLLRSSTASGSAAAPFRADANGIGWQVNSSGNLVNLSTASETITLTALATTSTDAAVLTNTTAATNAVRAQFSPRVRWLGTEWIGGASQNVEWFADIEPGANNASSDALLLTPRVNGSASAPIVFCNSGTNTFILNLDGRTSPVPCDLTVSAITGMGSVGANNVWGLFANSSSTANSIFNVNGNGVLYGSAREIAFAATNNPGNASSGDTGVCRGAAGQIGINDGSSTCTNFRDIKVRTDSQTGLTALYNNVSTTGMGLPPIYATVASTGQTASIGTTNLQCGGAVCPAGKYRVTVYDVVTTTGTGTLTSTIGWNDGTAARTQTSAGVSTTATNFEQVQYTIKADGVNNITYATTLSVSGTYSIYVDLERLQ